MEYERHPVSALFPDMSKEDFDALKESIRQHGVYMPLLELGGSIIDGWHRYMACSELGIDPPVKTVASDEDIADIVEALNVRRRHLTPSQAAAAHIQLADWAATVGRPKAGEQRTTAKYIAKQAGVSLDTVKRTKKGLDAGYTDEIMSGNMTARQAAKRADIDQGKEPPTEQAPPAKTYGQLQKENAALERRSILQQQQVNALQHELEAAKVRIEALELEGLQPSQQGARLTELKEEIKIHHAAANKWQQYCLDERRDRKRFQFMLKKTQRELEQCKEKVAGLEADVAELR